MGISLSDNSERRSISDFHGVWVWLKYYFAMIVVVC